MINNVVLTGRLTKDAELRYTTGGRAVSSFTLAVNRKFTDSKGNSEADFINVIVWGKQAEALSKHTHKGSLIGITGRIQTRNYENQQGQRVYVTEVVAESFTFLESKREKAPLPEDDFLGRVEQAQQNQIFHQGEPIDIPDDDLPF
ncbi:single-strand DNA-binding protein [Pilibacter termitis]|uniref:Single-stranded DNA-binding protein n=1 Tax=Pilibacter termitis TaxID=263852 RepID=A0A1T4PF07_9ENTE|nr:single-stranded DNA-binding protein [Pilibacter termitis]SJZ89388.1 single-strand DNA-binding protein [Pilibacter termitis]